MKLNKTVILFFLVFTSFLFSSCKKTIEDLVPECVRNNTGTLKVTYGSGNLRHKINLSGTLNTAPQEIITPQAVLTQTVQLQEDTYQITISSINATGQTVNQQAFSAVDVDQCFDTGLFVNF